jgi:hypothetical protein
MSGSDIWAPPPAVPPPPRSATATALWSAGAAACVAALILAGAVLTRIDIPTRGRALPLQSTLAEIESQQGDKVLIEEGVAPDGRSYRFEVSRHVSGDLCSFFTITTEGPGGGGGGGGGCGGGLPLSFSTGSSGEVEGLTSTKVTSIELETSEGPITLSTKPLPSRFRERRYFLVVLRAGSVVTHLRARDARGKALYDKELDATPLRRRRP